MKKKIVVPDEALKHIPPEERDEVRAEIEKMMEDFDPDNPPGQPVWTLEDGAQDCPDCNIPLHRFDTAAVPEAMGKEVLDFLDCPQCGQLYERTAFN